MKNIFFENHDLTFVGGMAAIFLGICAIATVIGGANYAIESAKCANMRQIGITETYVSITTGCLVKHKGDWMTADTAMTRQYEMRVKP